MTSPPRYPRDMIGYGATPPPGAIGPNSTLIFEGELLAINGQS